MAKLFLHIGLHKTASSSFQLSCAANQATLQKQNVFFPLFNCPGTSHNKIDNHSIPLFSLYTTQPEAYPVNVRWGINDTTSVNQSYAQQLKQALGRDEDLLLSGEDIASLDADELSNCLCDLSSSGRDLVAFACVRSPYAFHCSQVQQQVKDGVAMNPVGLCPQRHRISKLKQIFGESLHWIPFADACRHAKGPVGTYLDFCGIDPTTITIHNSNEGRSAELVRIQNLLNHHQPRIRENALNPQHIRLRPFQGSRFLLQPEELAAVTDHLNSENAALEELLGPGFGDPDRPTSASGFASAFPALTYSLTALIGLLLQQQPAPIRSHFSLQDVQHFLLEDCDEAELRRGLSLDPIVLIQPLLAATTATTNAFPEFLKATAQQFINRL